MADAELGFRSSDAQPAPLGKATVATKDIHPTDSLDGVITQPPRVGTLDDAGQKVEKIFWLTQQFVIYQADDEVRYVLPHNYDVAKSYRRRISNLGGLRASIEDLKADKSINENEKQRAACETAWALSLAFEADDNSSSTLPNDILMRVDTRLRSLVKSDYRKQYVFANLAAFVAFEIVLTTLMLIGDHMGHWPAEIGRFSLFAIMGALGAFLSVIIRISSIDIDIDLSIWEHTFTGVTRILIGVIGAFVIGLALDSHLIDPTFGMNKDGANQAAAAAGVIGQPLAMYLILSFIAGFSESLVPNILRKGEQLASSAGGDAKTGPILKDAKPPAGPTAKASS